MQKFNYFISVIVLSSLMLGCAATIQKPAGTNKTVEQLYTESTQLIANNQLDQSHNKLKAMEIRFPFHELTHKLQLDLAMAYSNNKQTSKAVSLANRFIAQYPYHQNADYAYYIKAIANFNKGIEKISVTEHQDLQHTSSREAREAYKNFADLIRRFPTSKYSQESQDRVTHLRDRLASHEVSLAEASYQNNQPIMASQRAQYVIKNYPDTSAANRAQSLLDRAKTTSQPPVMILAATKAPEIILKEPTIATLHETVKDTPLTGTNNKPKIKREAWLLSQNPSYFTIQVTGTSQEQSLTDFIRDKQLYDDDAAYYVASRQGKMWFTALYGNFKSYAEAKQMAAELEQNIGIKGLWIRRYRDIQGQINSYAAVKP